MTTKIEWVARPGTTPESWNPISGCTKLSEGCRNCYAERMARRLAGRYGYPEMPHHFDVTLHPDRLEQPLHWRKKRTVFLCSMSDLFHDDVPFADIWSIWKIMRDCPQHTFLILTKRPRRMAKDIPMFYHAGEKPLPNVWLGTTIELPEYSYRAEYLRQTPAAMRYISFEPLLSSFADYPGVLDGMDQVIVGGESGPQARPAHIDWARNLRDQCKAANIAYFYKQHGAWIHQSQWASYNFQERELGTCYHWPDETYSYRVGKKAAGRLLDGREWNEFPASR